VPMSIKPRSFSTPLQAYTDFVNTIADRYEVSAILDAPSLGNLDCPLRRIPIPKLSELEDAPDARFEPSPGEIAFVQFSSGSTAMPKGIPISNEKLAQNLHLIAESDGRHEDDRGTSWLPLYHDMGLVGCLLSSIYSGISLHLASPQDFLMDPLGWLRQISERRATITAIPNFAIDYCLRMLREADTGDLEGLRLDSMRFVYLGSEPICIENLKTFSEILAPYGLHASSVKPCYGMAEAVLMVTCVGRDETYRVVPWENGCPAISVGKPQSGFELRLRSETGALCGERELGEIEIRGGSLARSYYKHPHSLSDEEGFYATGDLGFVDGGEVFILGRSGDRFKINAQSYFASDFEQALEGLDFVLPARTAAVQIGDRVRLLIEAARREARETLERRQHVASERILTSLGVKVAPEDVHFVSRGQLERTSSGKLRRRAIAEAFQKGRLRFVSARE